jgi:PAS domain S-box-containing protein
MKDQSLQVLMVEDSELDELLIISELKKGGYNPVYERVDTAADMKKALQKKQWDIILCDYTMPKFDAPLALTLLKKANIDTPAIILSGTIGEETAVECMRLGARDYVMKGNLSLLCPAVARELEDAKVRNKQKEMEEALQKAALDWQITFDATSDAICLLNTDQRILRCNHTMAEMFGVKPEELIGRHCWEIVHGTMEPLPECPVTRMKSSLVRENMDMQREDRWFSVTADPILDETHAIQDVIHIVRDITERKRAEAELNRLNRALRMLSVTNQALIHIMDETTLLNEVCRIAVEVGGYRMAWIGFVEQDEAKTVRPVAHAGFDSGYIESVNVTWADNERGRGPGGTAIRTGQPSIACNILQDPAFAPWRESAIQHGYKSNIALPLISAGRTLGELSIYSVEVDAFDDREVEILKELADDLAFGITALRTRAQRDQTEVELRKSEERYRLIAENTADTIAVLDLNLNKTYISPSITKLRGYTAQETMTKTLDQILTPDSLQKAIKTFADQMALESNPTADPARTATMELEEYCKNGSTIWVELAASFLRDDNLKPQGILTVTRDITERKRAEMELKKTLESLRKAFGATVGVMVSVVEMRDPYTAGHQRRVTDLACAIATETGLAQEKIEGIRMAGSIHDIGKLSIPAEILVKPTRLTDVEFTLVKGHPRSGYEMLKDVESLWPLAEIVYQHHERMDGSGYPRNLKGDEIIMEARIMAVADVVEAMASHRPYRPALGINAALEEIQKHRGILYDADVADACLRLFREKGYQLA